MLLILADDLGYGDLGSYGSETIETPHLDALAAEGVRFTAAYSGSSVCTPARAALLTGRMGPRLDMPGRIGGVYFPGSEQGLQPSEVTLAEVFSSLGYTTALFGKWHLGERPEFLPTKQGFEHFHGLLYSNDMAPLPLMDGEGVVEQLNTAAPGMELMGPETAQAALGEELLAHADAFIRQAHAEGRPFFLYYPSHMPHVPLAPSARFAGHSPRCDALGAKQACGTYADVVAELDDHVGALLATLAELAIEDETIVIFTSDNGAATFKAKNGGSNGHLRAGKLTTFEGGFMVPLIARYPDHYRRGSVESTPVSLVDWFPTLLEEIGHPIPFDRSLDGHSLYRLLRGRGDRDGGSPFRFVYYRPNATTPGAYRAGKWKFKAGVPATQQAWLKEPEIDQLYDLISDPGEEVDLSQAYPDRMEALRQEMLRAHMRSAGDQ